MVDIETFKVLHPRSSLSESHIRDDLGPEEMASNEPPPGDFLLLFPPTIPGYNMRKKTWGTVQKLGLADTILGFILTLSS